MGILDDITKVVKETTDKVVEVSTKAVETTKKTYDDIKNNEKVIDCLDDPQKCIKDKLNIGKFSNIEGFSTFMWVIIIFVIILLLAIFMDYGYPLLKRNL